MANHSPRPDNYPGKKTWEQAMNGEAATPPDQDPNLLPAATPQPEENEARKNGGGAKTKAPSLPGASS